MSSFPRPLFGSTVSLSISESEESAGRRFPLWQVNRVTLQVVAALFGQGAGVIFGHDWREDGVMEAVHGFAQQVQAPVPLSNAEAEIAGQPVLRNCLAWPDVPYLPTERLERLASTLSIEQVGLPEELSAAENGAREEGPDSRAYQYLRARSLTAMRHRLTVLSNARLCIGGRRFGFQGRYAGVVEEALFALQMNKPLYVAGALGGATEQIINAINGFEMPGQIVQEFQTNDLYRDPPIPEINEATRRDRECDGRAVWQQFRNAGRIQIAKRNGLTEEENAELFQTPVVDRVIQLVLTGLARIKKGNEA